MNLKNYTTEVPSNRSIENIEKLLVDFGATNIMKEYGPAGRCAALSFIVEMNGMKLPFRLPGKVDAGYVWLKKKYPKSADKRLLEQAERMIWKQLYDWVFLQLCQIELSQMEKLEAFFPYLYDIQNRVTYYDKMKAGEFKGLLLNN